MRKHVLFGVVLAAGKACRFGSLKQLHPVDGIPMVRRAVRLAEQLCGAQTVLVAGHDAARVAQACAPQQGFVSINSDYALGLSSSIACGVRSVANVADSVLILLADQPRITAAHLHSLIAASMKHTDSVVVSSFAGTIGPPAIFPRETFAQLKQLRGDVGARSVAESAGDRLVRIDCDDAAIDIDFPEDLHDLTDTY